MSGIVHVVLVRWAESAERASAEATALIDNHLPCIPGIESIDRGLPVGAEGLEGGFDWMLVVRFGSRADLDAYAPHVEHQPVAEFIRARAERIVVFDIDASADRR